MSVQFNVDQALDKLGQLVAQHGPQVIDIAAQTVRIDAIGAIVGGLGAAAMAVLFFRGGRWALGECQKPSGDIYDDKMGYGLALGLCGLGFVGFATTAFCMAADPWTWIALFNPKLALAHEIIARVTQ